MSRAPLDTVAASGDGVLGRPVRGAAALAAAATVVGTALVVLAVTEAGPGPTGYVSEAGVAGTSHAGAYRIGVGALAAALLLLAAALPRVWRWAAALLCVAAGLTAISAAVTCSAGCPLPPFEPATPADLVHGGASVAAVAAAVFAMAAVAVTPGGPRRVRAPAVGAVAVALPLAGAVGLAILLAGRGLLVGTLERLLLADLVVWGLVTSIALATAGRRRPRRPHRRGQPG